MRYALICLGLIACTDKETDESTEPTNFTDEDDDGHLAGEDCDDSDGSVYPGADELCDGIDNDCDGEIDNAPVDGTVAWADSDGDGFGDGDTRTDTCTVPDGWVEVGGDCNDDDDAIHPDADELCDRVDNNCDDKVDNDPVDTTTFYIDADLDGYGSDETSVQSCDLPVGYSENDDDCNDSNPRTSPAADEIACDGIDNNCDNRTDLDVVPRDHATVQDAIDALADGSEICLSAGTYTDALDLTGRRLTLTGQDGPRSTRFDIGTSWPMVTVGAGSNITIQSVSLRDSELLLSATDVMGAFAHVTDGALTLNDVQVTDAVVSLDEGATLSGLLVYGERADVSVSELLVENASFTFESSAGGGSLSVEGGILHLDDASTLELFDVEMTDTTVATAEVPPADCDVAGLLAHTQSTAVTGDYVSFTGTAADLNCASAYVEGLALATSFGSEELSNVTLDDNTLTMETADTFTVGMLSVFGVADAPHRWSMLSTNRNDVSTTTDNGFLLGVSSFSVSGSVELDHLTAYGNETRAEGPSSTVAGGALFIDGSGLLSHIDLRGNATSAADEVLGAGALLVATDSDSMSLTNVIVAANTAESTAGTVEGAGLFLDASSGGSISLVNADFVENAGVAADTCSGGGVYVADDASSSLTVTNVGFSGNTCTGTGTSAGQAAAIVPGDSASLLWTYNNLYEQPTDAIAGIPDPTGTDGNVALDPKYSGTNGNPSTWDLRLTVRSEVLDMGDPAILDADGTVSDIGAYGGPAGADW